MCHSVYLHLAMQVEDYVLPIYNISFYNNSDCHKSCKNIQASHPGFFICNQSVKSELIMFGC